MEPNTRQSKPADGSSKHYGYGAGRRMCPDMHLAEHNMWRIASEPLWAVDISEPVNPIAEEIMHLDRECV